MKFKLVPEAPAQLDFVADAQRAVPLVPGTEDDCCARLMRRLDFESRDVARTWLTFLRAMELADETDDGSFVRRETDPTEAHLTDAFERRVYGASDVLALLDDDPKTIEDVFDGFEDRVPVWEHHRAAENWRDVWTERVGRILDWAVLLDLAERRDGGYVAANALDADR
ncbi:hypothetical protein C499_02579 [Halogeometricum borinquense DSM 11551]|uniref:Uncharacterized protein n=2 Tax=Halogeometricum borinquense TaxID=60847 RepID=E4NQ45_HALBP|nr:hypothetical protein [Halogeometricum borinquense]ADQ66607.1 hypothetical protein Hbor_10130 [Halogeometricum borinquense DSM 11551]ELY30714.1 hypothetical protein C499_02579 [Halogeometricum borinquense DSM 11551]RYJ14458.1 hypothetical protein ELS19_11185 [Halogeometricum borinquense]